MGQSGISNLQIIYHIYILPTLFLKPQVYIKGHFIYRFILCFMNRKNRSESEESRGQQAATTMTNVLSLEQRAGDSAERLR